MFHQPSSTARGVIIGHLGVAFAARRGWPRAPLAWLLVATFAPDIWRILLAQTRYGWWPSNTYSHALPWSAMLATVLASLAWLILRDGPAAIVVALLVATHVALDMISGWKPLWLGGPVGLDLQHVEQAEFLVEAVLAWLGWRLLTRANAPRWLTTKTALLVMLAAQLLYLSSSYNDRPADKRCLAYPFAACWRRL